MPNDKIQWANDHTEICDRLDARVQLMQSYLDSKPPDDFESIAIKRCLLSQTREQVTWYRQSIGVLDFVGAIVCRRSLEIGCDPIPTTTKGSQMLVRLKTADYLIYAELDKTEHITYLALKNQIRPRTCYAIFHEIEQRSDFQVAWCFADDGYSDTVQISRIG